MARIGFVGLGNMGGPMSRNLVNAGHEVKGFDLVEDALNHAVQCGVKRADSVKDAASVCGVEAPTDLLGVVDRPVALARRSPVRSRARP